MFEKFAEMANGVIRNMYQAIFDLNTTAVLIDPKGKINYIWRNIASLEKYILNLSIDEIITAGEPSAECLIQVMEEDGPVEAIRDVSTGESMILLGLPIHAQNNRILGALGFFAPLDTGNIGYVRGILKITVDALEGQWKALEYRRDYDSMYQNS